MESKFTNFSIEEILKPDFGNLRKYSEKAGICLCQKYDTIVERNLESTKPTPGLASNDCRHRKPLKLKRQRHSRTPDTDVRLYKEARIFTVRTREDVGTPTDSRMSNDERVTNDDRISNDTTKSSLSGDRSPDAVRICVASMSSCARSSTDSRPTSNVVRTTPSGACSSNDSTMSDGGSSCNDVDMSDPNARTPLPAWVFCTRYSDRPSAGPRSKRRTGRKSTGKERQRTTFSTQQLDKLKQAFEVCPYLTDHNRCTLSCELNLEESKIKIWFQNKRAKSKKAIGRKNSLAQHLLAQGLYNHANRQQGS